MQPKHSSICGHHKIRSRQNYKPSTVILLARSIYGLNLSHSEAIQLIHLPATRHLPMTEVVFKLVTVLGKVRP